ncbi:shikimate kinase [Thalassobacillus cyri]|uniref:Shikimate kinase n=1 Tax=Thalassobacillus cyri TaxID=571932 RepID=A0A1H4GSB8_9BACI|nr:shikimate kinase [Thalassobacillus cyri]SEB12536.1 shikimate kinase [Thalassobacillus cyri]
MKTIYLIGFMGSGKTTVAEILCQQESLTLMEMDDLIEQSEGRKIKEIFAENGEAYFRKLETALLQEIPAEDVVVSTGGGVPMNPVNQELMRRGTVIFLDASFDIINKRLSQDVNRPLWKGKEDEKFQLLEERRPIYEQAADYVMDVDEKSPELLAKEILHVLS